jgi:hypothetical protein
MPPAIGLQLALMFVSKMVLCASGSAMNHLMQLLLIICLLLLFFCLFAIAKDFYARFYFSFSFIVIINSKIFFHSWHC